MWRRLWLVCALVGGCWSDTPLIDDAFTPEQWARLQVELAPQRPDACLHFHTLPSTADNLFECQAAEKLGQELFFETRLSSTNTVSCATCHDPTAWFIDTRTENNTSLGAVNWTKRNSMTVVNMGLKEDLASGKSSFTWSGQYTSAGAVIDLAITKAMSNNFPAVVAVITGDPEYLGLYDSAFRVSPSADPSVLAHTMLVFDAYMRRLISLSAPFDNYLAGDDSAIDDSAKRGFAVFVGRGQCIECHSGPMFSDLQFHNTGVPQIGENVPATDLGRGSNGDAAEIGAFETGSLRQIAQTGPYMHDGSIATLGEVIEFYRRGGGAADYSGTKDPRLVPLEIDDADARDLEAFLRTLTGTPIQSSFTTNPRGSMTCTLTSGVPGMVCAGICTDTLNDPNHCGSCANRCMTGASCMGGSCVGGPPPLCPPPLQQCPLGCFDLMVDPMNCGSCGHVCANYCATGTCH